MHCQYRVRDTRLLMEANPGELFTFLGPDLVECVCTVRSHDQGDGVRVDAPTTTRLNPDAMVPVVVIACRSERGEPEFYPTGYQIELPGAAPIIFLERVGGLTFRAIEEARLDVPEPPAPVDPASLTKKGRAERFQRKHHNVGPAAQAFLMKAFNIRFSTDPDFPPEPDLSRPELMSRL